MRLPLVTSHAACKGHAPENTLAGIEAALRLGADAIEIDVHCTSDGVPVLIQALEDRETYVAQMANFALQSITGQDFGVNLDQSARERKTKAAAAMKWWEKNKAAPSEGVCLEAVELPGK